MVSLLRKPIGFAFLLFILEQLYSYALIYSGLGYRVDSSWLSIISLAYVVPVILAIVFSYAYVRTVKAHLSQSFRITAVLLLLLLTFVSVLALNFPISPFVFRSLFSSGYFWISSLIAAIIHYMGMTVGNWLASGQIKTQGHI